MVTSRWMLGIGYCCLALTIIWMSAQRGTRGEQPLGPITQAVRQEETAGAAPTVVLLLNPQDCASRIEALTAWNALHQSGRARVVGLVSNGSGDAGTLETIRSGAGMRFPLQPIAHRRMVTALRGLNYSSTPVALVLDSSHRLRMAVPLYEENAAAAARAVMLQLQSPPALPPLSAEP